MLKATELKKSHVLGHTEVWHKYIYWGLQDFRSFQRFSLLFWPKGFCAEKKTFFLRGGGVNWSQGLSGVRQLYLK